MDTFPAGKNKNFKRHKRKEAHYYLPERRIGPYDANLLPLKKKIKFAMGQLSQVRCVSRTLRGSNQYGTVEIHRINDMIDNVTISVAGGGYIILLHQERNVVVIFDWNGNIAKVLQLYTPLHSPLTREDFDAWPTPELHNAPTGYPTNTGNDWIYWFWWWQLKPPAYITDGDDKGFGVVYGDNAHVYDDVGAIAYGHRYNWAGEFQYSIDLQLSAFGAYTVANKWWYTRDKNDGTKSYAIIIQSWANGQNIGNTEQMFVILYEVDKETFAYTQIGYIETPIVTLANSVHRYTVDCVSMQDDCFYVHFVEGDFTLDLTPEGIMRRQMHNCTHYIRKYDYTITQMNASAAQPVSVDNYNGYMGPFSYTNSNEEEIWVEDYLWFGDSTVFLWFYRGNARLYADSKYIVYSNMTGKYHASWNADLTFRSDGLSPETVNSAPFNHRSLVYLGTKDEKVYMFDSELLTPAGQEQSISDYAAALADTYNYDSDKSDTYDTSIPAYGALMRRTFCNYRENLYYRETPLPGFVKDGLKL